MLQPNQPSQVVNFSACYWHIQEMEFQAKAGCGVLVAVLDTGINKDHCVFQDWKENKIAFGKNFVTDESSSCTYFDHDPDSHGTGVASVIAGKHISSYRSQPESLRKNYKLPRNLAIGVATKASLVVCRVAIEAPKPEYVTEALKWIYVHNKALLNSSRNDPECKAHKEDCGLSHIDKTNDKISIVNMSFVLTEDNMELEKQILKLKGQKVICVAGFGNDGNNWSPGYPGRYLNVLSVGAVDKDGQKAGFSTSSERSADVHALGKDVLVAVNTAETNLRAREQGPPTGKQSPSPGKQSPPAGEYKPPPLSAQRLPLDYSFERKDGTSFATPAVSGLIAILLQRARDQDLELADPHLVLAECIGDINILKELFEKYLLDKGGLKIITPEQIHKFFQYDVNNLKHVIQGLLVKRVTQ